MTFHLVDLAGAAGGRGGAWGTIVLAGIGVLVVALLVVAIILLLTRTTATPQDPAGTRSAARISLGLVNVTVSGNGTADPGGGAAVILRERFARGEIDEQEFTARLDALRKNESDD